MTVIIEQCQCAENQKHAREQKHDADHEYEQPPSKQQKVDTPAPYDPVVALMDSYPSGYKKIHARWPHLSEKGCFKLMKIIRAAPNHTISCHSDEFAPIEQLETKTRTRAKIGWKCCHYVSKSGIVSVCEHDAINEDGVWLAQQRLVPMKCQVSPDRLKPSPYGVCDKPTTFSLEADDFPEKP